MPSLMGTATSFNTTQKGDARLFSLADANVPAPHNIATPMQAKPIDLCFLIAPRILSQPLYIRLLTLRRPSVTMFAL